MAKVLANFASSPNGFIVKGINVQPAGAARRRSRNRLAAADDARRRECRGMPGRGGLQTVLNEQLLRVTMEIEIVKPTLKN